MFLMYLRVSPFQVRNSSDTNPTYTDPVTNFTEGAIGSAVVGGITVYSHFLLAQANIYTTAQGQPVVDANGARIQLTNIIELIMAKYLALTTTIPVVLAGQAIPGIPNTTIRLYGWTTINIPQPSYWSTPHTYRAPHGKRYKHQYVYLSYHRFS